MKDVLRFLLLLGALLPLVAGDRAERETRWRQDLKFMEEGLSAKGHAVDLKRGISTRGQIDFVKVYPEAKWKAAMEALDADLPAVSDSEIVLRIMRLIASANISHNMVHLPENLGFFERLPLYFRWYSDGPAVIAASPQYSSTIGARVLKIGGKDPSQLLVDLAPYISHENEVWLRQRSSELLRPVAILRHLGLTDADGNTSVTLQKPDGDPFTVLVKPDKPTPERQSLADTLHVPTALFRSQPKAYYWHRYLEDSQTFYIQYNRCANDPKLRFSEFAAKALADLDSHPVKRIVIDLRQNGGGDSRVINPLVHGLSSRLKNTGPLYVIIGSNTFSSAEDNAIDLQKTLHAKLVGEPAGGKPSSYGEIKTLTLPNSKLVVQYTTKWFGTKADDTAALVPDILVPYALPDLLSGSDPALKAAIADVPPR